MNSWRNGKDKRLKLICTVCHKPIEPGPYKREGKKNYHMTCYARHVQPRCRHCGEPIAGDYIKQDGKNYHTRCFNENIALRCSLCGKSIRGHYTKDYWGNIYHAAHLKQSTACEYCGRLIHARITGGGKKYSDGRAICALCLKNTTDTLKEAQRLMRQAAGRLAEYEIDTQYPYSLSLADCRELSRLSGRKKINCNHLGFTRQEKKYVNNKLTSVQFSISILTGLPEMHFLSTAAHELMHIWQYVHGARHPAAIVEGSCNYASYLVLKERRDSESAYILHTMHVSKNRVYGEGFRKVQALVEKRGIPYWLDYLRK